MPNRRRRGRGTQSFHKENRKKTYKQDYKNKKKIPVESTSEIVTAFVFVVDIAIFMSILIKISFFFFLNSCKFCYQISIEFNIK